MAHEKDDGLTPLVNPQSSPQDEPGASDGASRPSRPRSPPRVWPPMSPGDMGRVVRRLKLSAERVREAASEAALLEGAA